MKAARASQWCGLMGDEIAGLAVAAMVYLASIALAEAMLRAVASGLWPRVRGARGLDAACAAIAGAGVWAVLSLHREFVPTSDDALVAAALGGMAVGHATGWLPPGIAAAALAAGIAGVFGFGEVLLFHPERARWVTAAAVGYPAIAIVILLAGHRLMRPGAWRGRAVLAAVSVAVPALAAYPPRWPQGPGTQAPNLVFIVSDTLRAKDLSFCGDGSAPTPHLEALAASGANFARAHALAPWTLPSMTGMFASQYPPGLTPDQPQDVWNAQLWQYRVPEGTQTLAQRLRDAGYATGAVAGNALLWVMPGMMEGFDAQAKSHPMLLMRGGPFRAAPLLQAVIAAHAPALAPLAPQDTTRTLSRYAWAFLRRHRDRPFCLWLHYIDPHAPYDPPARYRTMQHRWPFFYPYKGGERWGIPVLGTPGFGIDPADRPYTESLYRAEIRHVDRFAGAVLALLDARRLRERTYVCFTSDHGEELWEHGDWGHGQSMYEELLHVPLIVAGPDVRAQRIEAPVSAIDLSPTLADLLGIAPCPAWRGQSLAAVLRDAAPLALDRPIFAQGTHNKSFPEPQQMVLRWPHKLIREAGSGRMRLFDLERDPEEQVDLAPDQSGIAMQLTALLTEWLASFPPAFPAAPDADASPVLEESLRTMGYL